MAHEISRFYSAIPTASSGPVTDGLVEDCKRLPINVVVGVSLFVSVDLTSLPVFDVGHCGLGAWTESGHSRGPDGGLVVSALMVAGE